MNEFQFRHIGPRESDVPEMLREIGVNSIEELVDQTIPSRIRAKQDLDVGDAVSEYDFLKELKAISLKNKVCRNMIGLGYYPCIIPGVIQRNIFENPGWYTQYTPYQAEISQGRLEALLNYQTMVSDLTALPIANASLLDEGTAAAEAMHMLFAARNKRTKEPALKILVDQNTFPQTIDVLKNRALPHEIEIVLADPSEVELNEDFFALLLSYPGANGVVRDYSELIGKARALNIYTIMAADILSLALLKPPGELGADVAIGSTQRLGVPMGFGGPHAAYFACTDEFKRQIPGRIIGVSVDKHGNRGLRMALQTREQHIKREKATSNICTAQALLAIMSGMYGVYHGPEGIRRIASKVHANTQKIFAVLEQGGYAVVNDTFFDTLLVYAPEKIQEIRMRAEEKGYNFNFYTPGHIGIAVDETTSEEDLEAIRYIFDSRAEEQYESVKGIPDNLLRMSSFMEHPVFNSHFSETEMLRYIKLLEGRDLSLTHSMISLGSCTMKLNATTELVPLSWRQFSEIHPFAPEDQTIGYRQMIRELEDLLCKITGFDACSLQPNSGAQGEYAGLMVIRAYHQDRGQGNRHIALIPASAHGTNPASAVMAGMEVVVVRTDEMGNIDVEDLRNKIDANKKNLSCLMVTYPSTHGVFEDSIQEVCRMIHENGGLVYMDGANMNAQVGLTSPAIIGADVCHLNLHKTFAIPHGGGGPGMGPICCTADLAPYLPGNPLVRTGGERAIPAISAAPWGSASILVISYAYIRMLGAEGVTNATRYAILNANYLKARLDDHFPILYTGAHGRVAHEFIVDLRPFKDKTGIDATDVAKRLMDYGFHAPTVSFPVPGTMMIEPTESEPLAELKRFVDAMVSIRQEIEEVVTGQYSQEDNPIVNAPHTAVEVTADEWKHAYSRMKAAYPVPYLTERKFWPPVGKIDNTYGDRNLICTCPPIESYEEVSA